MTGKLGKPKEALEMLSKGIKPNSMAYSTMIEALVRARMADKTMALFSKMVEDNCRPNEFTKLGHAAEAHRLFCNMWSFHSKGDRDAYVSILETLCSTGKFVEAIDMLDKTHEKGITTDTLMYNMVFSALGKSKELKVSECKPDVVLYNSLINCLGKNGDLDEAHVKFKKMREKGLDPDVVTYNTLIECFGKTDKGRCSEAVDMYQKLKEQGLTPDSITYSILERLQSGSL
ncbi:pentatricopeptide repeat-containing protein, partial [Striga asiatica]